ncbi:MAG: spermidine synthase [Anaerolineae bacterium]
MKGNWFLLLVVFVSGMTTLAVELSASRLLGPFFGTSLIIWSVLIGLVLIYLTVGYYIGGRWADRHPHEATLYQITAWAAFAIGLIPFISRPILRYSLEGFATFSAGILIGSLLGVIILFSAPLILLGCVSPFAIRLAMRDVKAAGNIAGSIYALSTLGSIIGTFAPVLVLIPRFGTKRTFILIAVTLLLFSLIGLWRTHRRRFPLYALLLLAVIGLAAAFPSGGIKPGPEVIYEGESAYNYIRVLQEGDYRFLELNEGQAFHSVYNPHQLLTHSVWDYFLVVPYFNPDYSPDDVDSLALIGLAAGTVVRQYTAIYGPIPIDGVEIDPQIVDVGRRYFDMNEPNLRAFVQDGRYWLATTDKKYDIIAVDAYRPPYIPFHLTTREFFTEVKEHLTEEGVAAINAGRTATDYSLVQVLASTMKGVFPSVYLIDLPTDGGDLSNTLVVGTVQPTKLENFRANMAHMTDPYLLEVAHKAVGNLSEVKESTVVFTDDQAPIEEVVHRMILTYVTGREGKGRD